VTDFKYRVPHGSQPAWAPGGLYPTALRERERERERESFKVYYREKERERSLLGIIHNGGSRLLGIIHDGGSRAAPAVDSASPHYGLLDSVIAYMAKTAP
jgi:hypothetical protein